MDAGKTESLDPNTVIEVPEDRHGLYAIDVLDPDLVFLFRLGPNFILIA